MTVALFLEILAICSVVTGLLTEVGKKLNRNLSNNLMALFIGLAVGVCTTAVVFRCQAIPYTVDNVICMVLMGLASAVGAMVGYDKLRQTIRQIVRL